MIPARRIRRIARLVQFIADTQGPTARVGRYSSRSLRTDETWMRRRARLKLCLQLFAKELAWLCWYSRKVERLEDALHVVSCDLLSIYTRADRAFTKANETMALLEEISS